VIHHIFFCGAGGHGGSGKKQGGEYGREGVFHDLSLLYGHWVSRPKFKPNLCVRRTIWSAYSISVGKIFWNKSTTSPVIPT
jgi:hypothetical protein